MPVPAIKHLNQAMMLETVRQSGLHFNILTVCPGTLEFALRLFGGYKYLQNLYFAIYIMQVTAMSLTLLSNLGNQETELTTSTCRNMFSSLILISALTALLLYIFVERANTKRVGFHH